MDEQIIIFCFILFLFFFLLKAKVPSHLRGDCTSHILYTANSFCIRHMRVFALANKVLLEIHKHASEHATAWQVLKIYNEIQLPKMKAKLSATKCSLQAVNWHKDSSNPSASPDFMKLVAVFKVLWNGNVASFRLAVKPSIHQVASLPRRLYLLLFPHSLLWNVFYTCLCFISIAAFIPS